jgi:hypothetical protein
MRQVRVFGWEACKLGTQGVWDCDLVEKSTMEFLRHCTIDAEYEKGRGMVGRGWTDNWGGQIRPEIMRDFERSDEFREFHAELLQVAEAQAKRGANDGTRSSAEKKTSVEVPENPSEMSRREMADCFLAACNRESHSGLKVNRTHLWRAAGHKSGRQFQYWQRSSDKATEVDDRAFRRLLDLLPAEFISLLKKKGIFPPIS